MSEAKRGLIRITSNFTRQFFTICLGLLLVRMLLDTVGREGYSVIALMGASIGFTQMIQEVVRGCMVKELGTVYHGGESPQFVRSYNSAFVLSVGVAMFSSVVFALLAWMLPVFRVDTELLGVARLFVLCKGVQTVIMILSAPAYNMYLITERMVALNILMVIQRGLLVASAGALYLLDGNVGEGVLVYGVASAALVSLMVVIASGALAWRDRRLVPRPWLATRGAMRNLAHVGGWNAAVLVSSYLYLPLNSMLLAALLGNNPWSAIFGVAKIMGGYIFQLGVGVAHGVDAVATRISAIGDDHSMRRLVQHSTRLAAMASLPGLMVVQVLADPLMRLWLADRLDDPGVMIPPAVTYVRILAIGFAARAMTQGWVNMFYGAGLVRTIGPILLIGGVLNPVIVFGLFYTLPMDYRFTCVAWSFAFVFVLFSMVLMPMRTVGKLGMSLGDLYSPILRPLVAAAACGPILFLVFGAERVVLWRLALTVVAYALAYAVVSLRFVVTPQERKRFLGALMRKLGAAGASQ